MLDLEKHINDLLYNYDCVIVPGLGGFVANNKNATLNEKTGIFSPPRREIGFNKSLSHNDGLLISHMSSAHGISFEECSSKLARHIHLLKEELKQGVIIAIGDAGELKNDALGNTLFIPNLAESFAMDSYGLSTFHFNTLNEVKEQNETTRRWVRHTLQSRSVRQIAASVTLIIGMLFVSPEIGNQMQQSAFTDMFPKTEYHVAPAVDNDEAITANLVSDLADATENMVSEVQSSETVALPIESQNSYFIIGASFKEEHQAKTYLKNLSRKGIEGAEIISANKRFRVSLEGFNNKEIALGALENYRKKNGSNSVWLLKN